MGNLTFEIKRKFFHVAMLGYILIYIFILNSTGSRAIGVLSLGIILVLFIIIEYYRIHKGLKIPFFGKLWRKEEKRIWGGEIYYMIGVIVALLFFDFKIALTAIFMLAFGDSVATIVGLSSGKTKLKTKKKKTLQGSTAELITNLIVGYLILRSWTLVIPMALAATLAETYSNKIDDNLAIPIYAGAIGQLVRFLI